MATQLLERLTTPTRTAHSAFKIEKGIAPPDGRCTKYPFDQMDVGDSFEAPDSINVRRSASSYAKRHNKAFTCRKPERGAKVVRVWRTA